MFTIIGSGFGLYGYLPALLSHLKEPVTLQRKYFPILKSRDDLNYLLEEVNWVSSSEEALAISDHLILAVPPLNQAQFLSSLSKTSHIKKIMLEKPIAVDPYAAIRILDTLFEEHKSVRVGFSFLSTEWYLKLSRLNQILSEGTRIKINWSFQANHFKKNIDTWKRYHSQGGGVLRFYGIHIIAMLTDLGFEEIIESELLFSEADQPYIWKASMFCQGKILEIMINSNSHHNHFQILTVTNSLENEIVNISDPFTTTTQKCQKEDNRVPVLAKIIKSFHEEDDHYHEFYYKVCCDWLALENKTRLVYL